MINYKRLMLSRKAGSILRAHTVPLIKRQTVGEHTYGVLHVLLAILGDRLNTTEGQEILVAALYHDMTEAVLGDTPAVAKWQFAELEEALKKAEDSVCQAYGIVRLTPGSFPQKVLKYADYMELALFCIEEMKMGNTRVETMGTNVLMAIESRSLADLTPETRELYDLADEEFNKWKRNRT